jgi:hypothetical protein
MSGTGSAAVPSRVPAGRGWRWIVAAWTLTAAQRPLFVALVLGLMVAAIAVSLVPLVGSIATGLLTPVLQAGLVIGCDALRRGEPLKADHLFAGFEQHTGRLVGLGAVSVLAGLVMLIVGAAIVGPQALGTLLSGAPPAPDALAGTFLRMLLAMLVMLALSLPLYMALWFAVPLIALRGLDVGAAMSASFAGCLRNMPAFLVWSVAVLAIALVAFLPFFAAVALHLGVMAILVGTLPCIVGGVALAALWFASMYTSYRDVFGATD